LVLRDILKDHSFIIAFTPGSHTITSVTVLKPVTPSATALGSAPQDQPADEEAGFQKKLEKLREASRNGDVDGILNVMAKGGSTAIRVKALAALSGVETNSEDPRAFSALRRALHSSNPMVRYEAIRAIGRTRKEAAVAPLISVLDNSRISRERYLAAKLLRAYPSEETT
jgi:HEAT repeat protein